MFLNQIVSNQCSKVIVKISIKIKINFKIIMQCVVENVTHWILALKKNNLPVTYFYIGVFIMLPNYSTLSPSLNDEHLGLENQSIQTLYIIDQSSSLDSEVHRNG